MSVLVVCFLARARRRADDDINMPSTDDLIRNGGPDKLNIYKTQLCNICERRNV
jgi:hypothetical protein